MTAPSDKLPANVLDALRRGQKIEAIKLLREQTGIGLKEAKDAVEAQPLEPGSAGSAGMMRRSAPGTTGGGPPGAVSGSSGVLRTLVVLALIGLAIYFFARGG